MKVEYVDRKLGIRLKRGSDEEQDPGGGPVCMGGGGTCGIVLWACWNRLSIYYRKIH